MDQRAFEASLQADGFPLELTEKVGPPGGTSEPHTHPFSIRGLVLAGEFILHQPERVERFGPGEVFDLPAHCPHHEAFGPSGSTYIIAKRVEPT